MLNFTIVSMSSEEYIEEICNDIAYQVKNGIATMPLFSAPLFPEGTPAIDKGSMHCSTYRRFKKQLDEIGVPSGVLIQSSIGHGNKPRYPVSFQKYVGLADGKVLNVCCPLDKEFQAYIRDAGAKIAAEHPKHIILMTISV